jgi:hypothetical protein
MAYYKILALGDDANNYEFKIKPLKVLLTGIKTSKKLKLQQKVSII